VATGTSCALKVDVKGTAAGNYTNFSTISSSNGGTGNISSADLIVNQPSYAVTGSVTLGSGTIDCQPSIVTSGGSSDCTLTPDAGWYTADLTDNLSDVFLQIVVNKYTIPNVTEAHAVAVTFQEYFVRRVSSDNSTTNYYLNVQSAFDTAVNGDKISFLDLSFPEAVTFDKPTVSVLLEGGYVSGFRSSSGFTVLNGKFTIKGGKVVMKNIKVK